MNAQAKRIVVTGAAGFIGRHALGPLMERGFEVHAVDVREPEAVPAGVRWHAADLFQAAETGRLIGAIRPSHLLHLAWFVKHGEFWGASENLRWVPASLDLYQAFHAAGGTRMVTSGTCAEYDWSHGELVEEETPLHPATLYGACKHGLHTIARAYAAEVKLSAAWGRVFLLYGPGEDPRRLVAGAIHALLKGEPFPCSHGRQIRDFLHVQDVGDAFAALVDSPVEGAVNIASGEACSIAEVLSTIAHLLDREELIKLGARPSAPHDPPELRAVVDRLKDEVGWAPSYSLQEGLADAAAWWRAQLGKES